MRTVKKIHKAEYKPIDDLITYSPLPSRTLQHIDPFLFLNHHGPQQYPPNNNGLPFGPHPHRGMETVTFILDGDILQKDSSGHESIIDSGGIQWMTAGRGLIHAETSSDKFKLLGGLLEILQLWINLPSKYKLIESKYVGLQKDKIPNFILDDGKVKLKLISGKWNGNAGAFETLTNVFLSLLDLNPGAQLSFSVPLDHNIFFYVIKGKVKTNGMIIDEMNLAEFYNDDPEIKIEAENASTILLGHAKPFNEPILAYGSFVMNTERKIEEAYSDYRQGKFGKWIE